MDEPETMIALMVRMVNMVLDPSQPLGSQPLLHLLAKLKLKPASSKNMNGFHQLPALSPSKTHVL